MSFIQTSCYSCGKRIFDLLEDCPHCGAGARDEYRRRRAIREGKPWIECLTDRQKEELVSWEVTILEMARRRGAVDGPVDASLVQRDTQLEVGGITDEKFNKALTKLENLALIRRYVTLNL